MEKQKLGSTPNEAPTLRKAYLEPKLSLISFEAEKGFANSIPLTGTSIKSTTVDDQSSLSTWI